MGISGARQGTCSLPDPELRARVAACYAGARPFARGYVRHKLRLDPVHAALLELAGPRGFGEVLDLGCGRGQTGVLLLLAGAARRVHGIERNRAWLAEANAAAAPLGFVATLADLATMPALPPADTVLLIDVLYQFETPAQIALLGAAAAAARRRVVIRSMDATAGLRGALTRFGETALRHLWPGSRRRINPLPITRLTSAFAAAGWTITVTSCAAAMAPANMLIVAERTGAAATALL